MKSGKIVLSVKRGSLQGREYVFKKHTRCIIGRADDCDIQLPREYARVDVSRHHCELDINPPSIQVRDLGSRNGTYVNGEKIGQRQALQKPEEADISSFPTYELHDGDEVQVGFNVFEVKEKP